MKVVGDEVVLSTTTTTSFDKSIKKSNILLVEKE
jgi:hypothetical protein